MPPKQSRSKSSKKKIQRITPQTEESQGTSRTTVAVVALLLLVLAAVLAEWEYGFLGFFTPKRSRPVGNNCLYNDCIPEGKLQQVGQYVTDEAAVKKAFEDQGLRVNNQTPGSYGITGSGEDIDDARINLAFDSVSALVGCDPGMCSMRIKRYPKDKYKFVQVSFRKYEESPAACISIDDER